MKAELSKEQREILHHTKWRAAGGMYCGSRTDPDIRILVSSGLLHDWGAPAHLPETDAYFSITQAGSEALKDA